MTIVIIVVRILSGRGRERVAQAEGHGSTGAEGKEDLGITVRVMLLQCPDNTPSGPARA